METSDPTPASGGPRLEDVCSLPADALRDRVASVRAEILSRVVRREALADGVALEFEHSPAMQKRLEEFVAFERRCCSGVEWGVKRSSGGALRLTIRGLPPDSELYGTAGAGRNPRARSLASRLARATGLGAGAAVFLCCVAPIGVAAVAGAAVAAPLAALDQPWVIAPAAALLAVPAWFWLSRREARSGGEACGPGC